MNFFKIFSVLIIPVLISCEKNDFDQKIPGNDDDYSKQPRFLTFSTNGQTLPAAIHESDMKIRFEIDHDADETSLIPSFTIPEGYTANVNGIVQVSGTSKVDFSNPVTYIITDRSLNTQTWEATAVKLKPRILIDATHDGGVWWFPQHEGTGFSQDKPHQGQVFANLLRQKGFIVDELGRGKELTEEMFFGYYIVVRANGFQTYTTRELEVYTNLVKRGMNLVFFTDHKKFDPADELGDHLGLKFRGIAYGTVTTFKPHEITKNITYLDYIAGSVLTGYENNKDLEVLGWLGENNYGDLNFNGVRDTGEPYSPAVMGVLKSQKSKIFFAGDMNGLQVMPQPFIDNLVRWMGDCF